MGDSINDGLLDARESVTKECGRIYVRYPVRARTLHEDFSQERPYSEDMEKQESGILICSGGFTGSIHGSAGQCGSETPAIACCELALLGRASKVN